MLKPGQRRQGSHADINSASQKTDVERGSLALSRGSSNSGKNERDKHDSGHCQSYVPHTSHTQTQCAALPTGRQYRGSLTAAPIVTLAASTILPTRPLKPRLPVILQLQHKGLRLGAHGPRVQKRGRIHHRHQPTVPIKVRLAIVRIQRTPRRLGRREDPTVVGRVRKQDVPIDRTREQRGARCVRERGCVVGDSLSLIHVVEEYARAWEVIRHAGKDFGDPIFQIRHLTLELGRERGVLDGGENAEHASSGPAVSGAPVIRVCDVSGYVGGIGVYVSPQADVRVE